MILYYALRTQKKPALEGELTILNGGEKLVKAGLKRKSSANLKQEVKKGRPDVSTSGSGVSYWVVVIKV